MLCGFAVAQPLLDVTGRSPETFLFYRVDGLELVAYALLLVFVPPIVLWLVVAGTARVSPAAGRVAHLVIAGAGVALIAVQSGKKVSDLRGWPLVAVAVVVAAGALILVSKSEIVRTFVRYLTPAPLVFLLLFLLVSPTADLVRPVGPSASAAAGSARGQKPPVVVILLDEFPLVSLLNSKGEVDGRVFPNFATLASTSNWYRNGTGVSAFTQYAVPAVLTGRYPQAGLAPSYVGHPDNLFSLLARDYRIRSFETITQLCAPEVCDEAARPRDEVGLRGLFGQTWHVAKEVAKPRIGSAPVSEQFAERRARETRRPARRAVGTKPNWKTLKANQPVRFHRFVSGLRATEAPTMHFLHLLMPHTPWRYLPSGTTYPDKLLGGVPRAWGKYRWPLDVNRQRHLLQVAYTDRLLGDVIDQLKREGIWDDALVVVTADHGESFLPGTSGRRLTEKPAHAAQIAWVPVFLKQPAQLRGRTSDVNWEQVDLLPTIADALGVEVPFKVDGISQLSSSRTRTTKRFYNDPDHPITFPQRPAFTFVLHGITDTLARPEKGQAGLYHVGPRPDWIGKSISELATRGVDTRGPPSRMTARLAPEIDMSRVDPSSGTVPALVSGTLTRSAGRGPVVIAVNGKVAAVSPIWPEQGKPSFAGMVNDELFEPGANDVALYEVVGDDAPELRPIVLEPN